MADRKAPLNVTWDDEKPAQSLEVKWDDEQPAPVKAQTPTDLANAEPAKPVVAAPLPSIGEPVASHQPYAPPKREVPQLDAEPVRSHVPSLAASPVASHQPYAPPRLDIPKLDAEPVASHVPSLSAFPVASHAPQPEMARRPAQPTGQPQGYIPPDRLPDGQVSQAPTAQYEPTSLEDKMGTLIAMARQAGIPLGVAEVDRSIDRQTNLYAQGRTAPGPVVTNAEPGLSAHGRHRAFDIAPQRPLTDEEYKTIGNMARSIGMIWGGDFKSLAGDKNHFELPSRFVPERMPGIPQHVPGELRSSATPKATPTSSSQLSKSQADAELSRFTQPNSGLSHLAPSWMTDKPTSGKQARITPKTPAEKEFARSAQQRIGLAPVSVDELMHAGLQQEPDRDPTVEEVSKIQDVLPVPAVQESRTRLSGPEKPAVLTPRDGGLGGPIADVMFDPTGYESTQLAQQQRNAANQAQVDRYVAAVKNEVENHPVALASEVAGNAVFPGVGEMARGTGEVVASPGNRLKGAVRATEGALETGSTLMGPAMIENPVGVAKGLFPGMVAQAAAPTQRAVKALGGDENAQALASQVDFFLPTFLGAAGGKFLKPRGNVVQAPEGTVATGDILGGKVGAGVAVTPEEIRVGGKFGSKSGSVSIPRAGAQPPIPEGPTIEAEPNQPAAKDYGFVQAFGNARPSDSFIADAWTRVQSGKRLNFADKPGTLESKIQAAADQGLVKSPADIQAIYDQHYGTQSVSPIQASVARDVKTAIGAAAEANAQDALATRVASGEPIVPPAPPEPQYPAVTDENLGQIAEVIKSLPPEQQGPALLEAHDHLSRALLQQGKVFVNGKVSVVPDQKTADKLATEIINDHVAAHDSPAPDAEVKASFVPDEPVAKHPWQMTTSEYGALPDERRMNLPGLAGGAQPYHSNYHLTAVLDAIERGEKVPQDVIDSFDPFTRDVVLQRHLEAFGKRGVTSPISESSAVVPEPTEAAAVAEPEVKWDEPTSAGHPRDVSPDEVAAHVARLWHSQPATADQVRGMVTGNSYELKPVEISSIPDAPTSIQDVREPELANEYAKRSTPLPPIVLEPDGTVMDGWHRLAAAAQRGDKTIQAYVPKAEPEKPVEAPKPAGQGPGTNSVEVPAYKPKKGDSVSFIDNDGQERTGTVKFAGSLAVRIQTPEGTVEVGPKKVKGLAEPSAEEFVNSLGEPAEIEQVDSQQGLTPAGSGTATASNEEVNRSETFYKVSKGGRITYMGKQPDATLRNGEGVVARGADGKLRVVNANGIKDDELLKSAEGSIAKAHERADEGTIAANAGISRQVPEGPAGRAVDRVGTDTGAGSQRGDQAQNLAPAGKDTAGASQQSVKSEWQSLYDEASTLVPAKADEFRRYSPGQLRDAIESAKAPKAEANLNGKEQAISDVRAAEFRAHAAPKLDDKGKPTGWLWFETDKGPVLVHPYENKALSFFAKNDSSGTEKMRAFIEASAYAVDNPVAPKASPEPTGELVTKPIFKSEKPAPEDIEALKAKIAALESKKTEAPAQKSGVSTIVAKRVESFRKMADGLEKQIQEKLRPNTQNPTPKRNAQEATRRFEARNLERTQRALRALADAHEAGTVPPALENLRTKDEIGKLVRKYLTGEGGYYGRVESTDYADKSPAGVALQGMIDSSMSPAEIAKRENANKLRNLEQEVSLSNIPGYFPTPKALAEKLVEKADIKPGMSVLEPSAGKGSIADVIKAAAPDAKIDTVEQQAKLRQILELKGYNVAGSDFLEHKGEYDRIVMNPPFENGQDIDHVRRAYEMLKSGGRLVAIMSEGPFFNGNKKGQDFRAWLDEVGGESEKNPLGSFTGKDSERQTGVATRTIVIDKPAEAKPKSEMTDDELGERFIAEMKADAPKTEAPTAEAKAEPATDEELFRAGVTAEEKRIPDSHGYGKVVSGVARVLESKDIAPREEYAEKSKGWGVSPFYTELTDLFHNPLASLSPSMGGIDKVAQAMETTLGTDPIKVDANGWRFRGAFDNGHTSEYMRRELETGGFGQELQKAEESADRNRRAAEIVYALKGGSDKVTAAMKAADETFSHVAKMREAAESHIKGAEEQEAEAKAAEERKPITLAEKVQPVDSLKTTYKKGWIGTAVTSGSWISDGHMALDSAAAKGKPAQTMAAKLRADVSSARKVEESKSAMDSVLEMARKSAKSKLEFLGTLTKEDRGDTSSRNGVDHAYFATPDGKQITVDAHKLALINKTITYDTVRGTPEKALSFEQNGKTVAVLMPMRAEESIDIPTARKALAGELTNSSRVVPGARSAFTGNETGKSSLQELTEAVSKMTPPDASMSAAAKIAREYSDRVNASKDGLTRSWNAVKAVTASMWDRYLNGAAKYTEFDKMVNEWTGAKQDAAGQLMGFSKEIRTKIPDKGVREAMVNYLEAGEGSDANTVLADRAEKAPLRWRKGYRDALNLTEEQKTAVNNFRNFMDSELEQAQKWGILEHGVENYVQHTWKRGLTNQGKAFASSIMAQLNATSLRPTPSFTKKRVWDTYFDGEQYGAVPENKDIAFLVSIHNQALRNAIADRIFIKSLFDGKASDGRPLVTTNFATAREIPGEDGTGPLFVKTGLKPEEAGDYIEVDHPALRKWKWAATVDDRPIFAQGELMVHPEIAKKLRNILMPSAIQKSAFGSGAMRASSLFKQTMLSGIPSFFHQTTVGLHAMEHKVNPFSPRSLDELQATPEIQKGIRRGLMMFHFDAKEAFSEGIGSSGGLLAKVPLLGPLSHKYTQYLFTDYIPRLKGEMFIHALDRNMKRYSKELSEDQIYHMTARQANAAFGELDYADLGRSKTTQDLLRLTLLAPDFLESRARFAAQAAKPYGKEQWQALLLGAVVLYTGARILNQMVNGDPEWKLGFGVRVGNKVYAPRTVQGDVMHLVEDPRGFIYSRLNPLTTRTAVESLTGRDQFGRERTLPQQAKDLALGAVPLAVQPLVKQQFSDKPKHKSSASETDALIKSLGFGVMPAHKPTQHGHRPRH